VEKFPDPEAVDPTQATKNDPARVKIFDLDPSLVTFYCYYDLISYYPG